MARAPKLLSGSLRFSGLGSLRAQGLELRRIQRLMIDDVVRD